MSRRLSTPLHFEQSKLLLRENSIELWEGILDGKLCLARRHLSSKSYHWNDFLYLSTIRNHALVTPSYAGLSRNQYFAWVAQLDFQPETLSSNWNPTTFSIQYLGLMLALQRKRLAFKCDLRLSVCDPKSDRPVIAGIHALRQTTRNQDQSRDFMERLRLFISREHSGSTTEKVLRKWERRKEADVGGCLEDLIRTSSPDLELLITNVECSRRKELEMIAGLFQLAARGRGKTVLFTADPGEGKSTLLKQIYRDLLPRNCVITFLSLDRDDRPYAIARKLFDRFFENSGAYQSCKSELAASKWSHFLDGSPDVPEERIGSAFLNVVDKLHSGGAPCFVFLVDDINRSDPQSLNVIRRVVSQIAAYPVLFIFSSNDSRMNMPEDVVKLVLEPLSADQLAGSYCIPLWKKEQNQRLLNHIYKRTSGNPLLYHEYIRETFRESQNKVGWENGEWFLPEHSVPELPGALSNFYLRQIPDLRDAERKFLQIASVQGSSFDPEFADHEPAQGIRFAQLLQEKGLVIPVNGRWQFRKAHLAEFLYREIDQTTLNEYHLNIANQLLMRSSQQEPARIAYHLLKAGDYKRALEFACEAVQLNNPGAVSLILPVLEDLEKDSAALSEDDQFQLFRQKGALLFQKGLYPAAAESYKRALHYVNSNIDERFELMVRIARCHLLNNDIHTAHKLLQEQSNIVSEVKEMRALLPYYLARGVCAWHRGSRDDSDFDEATRIAEHLQDYDSLAAGFRQRAELALRDGSLSRAKTLARKVVRYCRKTGNLEEMGQALRIIGSVAFRTSKYHKSERILKKSIRILKNIESLDSMARVWNLLGNMYLEVYRFHDAIKAFQNASRLFNQLGHPLEVSLARFNMGLIYIEQGRLNEAEKIYLRCRLIDKQAGNRLYYAYDIRALAVIAMQRGHFKKADKLLKRTIEICEDLKAAGDFLQTKMILLHSFLEQKNYRDAQPLIQFVASKLDELHHEPMARAEIHYLLGQYYGYTNDQSAGLKHLDAALSTAGKIRHYKLIGMALILQHVFRNAPPLKNDDSFRRALRYFRKSHNQIRCADSLLKLYEAFPALLREKQHSAHLSQCARLFRQARNRVRHRVAIRLLTSSAGKKKGIEPVYDWWQSLLAILRAHGELEDKLRRVLVQLSQELDASAAAIRVSGGAGEMIEVDSSDNNTIQIVRNFREAVFMRLQRKRETVNIEIRQEPDLLAHPATTLHDIHSVLAVPVHAGGGNSGMLYFERGRHQPAFSRIEAGKAIFFTTAAAPIMEQVIQADLSRRLNTEIPVREEFSDLIGKSPAMQELFKQMGKAAPVDISVLIFGESGTGKELIAKNLHRASRRSSGPFMALNCSALPETLLESELFGYARGAFTGATASRQGLIERAHGGTLFLDEIGDLTQAAQVKLLRVMQEKEIQRLGENITRKVDVRFIFATHKDLKKLVKEGAYRQDLFYRVSVHTLNVPPLRERKEDIPLLVHHLIEKYCGSFGKDNIEISASALQTLCDYNWPGNVRELENVIQSTLVNCRSGGMVETMDLPAEVTSQKSMNQYSGYTLEQAKEEFEREFLTQALIRHRWNKTQTAKDLNITRQGLMNMIQRLGIRDSGQPA